MRKNPVRRSIRPDLEQAEAPGAPVPKAGCHGAAEQRLVGYRQPPAEKTVSSIQNRRPLRSIHRWEVECSAPITRKPPASACRSTPARPPP